MEIISDLNQKKRYLFDMKVYPYLLDHHLEDKMILPAVESLILLAKAVKRDYPQTEMNCLKNAAFPRFLTVVPDTVSCQIFVDVEKVDSGEISASLITTVKSKTGNISRDVEHARALFSPANFEESPNTPFRAVDKLKGSCISVPSVTIYRELVPFGAAYQNIIGDLSVSSEGALAYISGGHHEADEDLLGSPFPLDAVMHGACVWGQRFAGLVSFPVGFEKRVIYQKTKKGEEYLGRVLPVRADKKSLLFDAWIYDKNNAICEFISGIEMKDVTGGRIKPPDWIKA